MLQGCNQKDQEKWVNNKTDNRIALPVLFARKPLAYSCGRQTLRCDFTPIISTSCLCPAQSLHSECSWACDWLITNRIWLRWRHATFKIMLCHLSLHPRPEQEIFLANLKKWGVMLSKPHGKELQVTAWHCRWPPDNSKRKAGTLIHIATSRWILPQPTWAWRWVLLSWASDDDEATGHLNYSWNSQQRTS